MSPYFGIYTCSVVFIGLELASFMAEVIIQLKLELMA